jgi:hypothetical protein
MLQKLNFTTIWVSNSILEFKWKIESKNIFAEVSTRRSRTAPCPRDANLRNGSRQEGERAQLQNNIKTKPEQLNLSKTYPSMWPQIADS